MHRRDLLCLGAATIAATLQPAILASEDLPAQSDATVEQWGLFEASLHGTSKGNPFTDVKLTARFTHQHRTVQVTGFYDGAGVYRIRFMPDATGTWTYLTASTDPALSGKIGTFTCTPPSPGNHGPVQVAHQFHFQHADGTPYCPFGTTTYAYLFTSEANAKDSLDGMVAAHFNKSRVCVMPKPLGKGSQILPYEQSGATSDLTRFNPAFFHLVEKRLLDLQKNHIEADCILFHPYDAWGYKAMGPEADDLYLCYAIARLSAFRNVWWAVANEYDLVKSKTNADWDRFFRILQAEDPYSHLRSIHHSRVVYDHSRPWCTHASLQSYDFEKSAERRAAWNKPIIYDEIQYEGDVDRRWGNLSAEEMTHRFWQATVRGVYASHGEVFISDAGEASWSDAGRLHGESGPRIAFLRALIERITKTGLVEAEGAYYLNAGNPNETILYYLDLHRPARYDFPLPVTATWSATIIDPFAMTETRLPGTFTGKSRIALPSRPYRAILFQKVADTKAKPKSSSEPLVPTDEPG